VERAVISLRIDPPIAMTANDFVSVDSTSQIFEDITDESILAELTTPTEPDETVDDTDNVIMPMPSKSDIAL